MRAEFDKNPRLEHLSQRKREGYVHIPEGAACQAARGLTSDLIILGVELYSHSLPP
jgi:hypothetical protein